DFLIQSKRHMAMPPNLPSPSSFAQLEVEAGNMHQVNRRQIESVAKVVFGNGFQVHAGTISFGPEIASGPELSALEQDLKLQAPQGRTRFAVVIEQGCHSEQQLLRSNEPHSPQRGFCPCKVTPNGAEV